MKTYKWMLIVGLILILTVPMMVGYAARPDKDPGDIPDIGELYGDLYVILRDVNGVPLLDNNGCIQPISTVTSVDPISGLTATAGEPFLLWTYVDNEGDLVECEMTETMATWAQTVDFGRLNLGRSPESVIDHAFDEAIKAMNDSIAIGTDPVGRLVLSRTDGTIKTIDSPAENLALYIKMMKDGHWITKNTDPIERGGRPCDKGPPADDGPSEEPRPVLSAQAIALLPLAYQGLGVETRTNLDLDNDELLLAASLLAAAADKTGNITLDKLVYINSIYNINQTQDRFILGETEDERYFNFSAYSYNQIVFASRSSGPCEAGWIWVLQPELDESGNEIPFHYVAQCMEILGYDPGDPNSDFDAVHFTEMEESYTSVYDESGEPLSYGFDTSVRGFVQAADDALQVLEYIHNYGVPEDLYGVYPEPSP